MAKIQQKSLKGENSKVTIPINDNTAVSGGITPSGEGQVGVGVQDGDVGISGGVTTGGQGQIGVGVQEGDVNIGAGINTGGQGQIGVSGNVTDDVSVGVGVNTGGNVGVGVGVSPGGNVSAGVGVGAAGITPTVQVGQGSGAQAGGAIGGTIGGVVGGIYGGPWGAAAGSLVGSAAGSTIGGAFDPSEKKHSEKNNRDTVINRFKEAGLWGEDYTLSMPDGTTFNFGETGGGSHHAWKYGDKRQIVNQKNIDALLAAGFKPEDIKTRYEGGSDLFNFEIDYTNDMDYVAGMAGITFSRLFAGGKAKHIDQIGNMMGNSFLGSVGYGNELTKDNFNTVMSNARSVYAKSGITSKEDMVALSNSLFAAGAISDTDYAVMNQTAGMVFDNDFNLANQLMAGRWDGLKKIKPGGEQPVESEANSQAPQTTPESAAPSQPAPSKENKPGRIYSPVISPEEAFLSVQPYIDYARANIKNPGIKPSSWAQILANMTGLIGAVGGLYKAGDKFTNGGLSGAVKDIFNFANSYVSGDNALEYGEQDPYILSQDFNYDSGSLAGYDTLDTNVDFNLDYAPPSYEDTGGTFDTTFDYGAY